MNRREFLSLAGAGAAAVLLSHPSLSSAALTPEELDRWKRELLQAAPPRLYRSGVHQDARLHLGGIGTGNIEIGMDGQITTWQLFNTLRDGQVPFYFAIRAGRAARLLQTAGGPDAPRVERIEMTGEYPFAVLRYHDAELPVEVELTAFSPFAPLDTRISSMPLAAFVFRLHNPGANDQMVSLAALCQNPVGYHAVGGIEGVTHPNYGANVNEVLREGEVKGLLMRAVAGQDPALDQPVWIFANDNLRGLTTPPPDRPARLTVEMLTSESIALDKLKNPAQTVLWMDEAPTDLPEPVLRSAAQAVEAGATLLFSGQGQPLLRLYAHSTGGKPLERAAGRPDMLFEDFEKDYSQWEVEGTAFGVEPAHGTLPNQQRVSGFIGKGLVNTYLEGDTTTGRLTSKEFTIPRHFIRFLVGGGHHHTTQMRLVVDGQVVRSIAGKDNERLEPAFWEVREWEGRKARLEIVDEAQGGWGHINIDRIEFSDRPGQEAVLALLEELLPVRFSDLRAQPAAGDQLETVQFENLSLREGAQSTDSRTGPKHYSRAFGRGKVIVAAGRVLDPVNAELTNPRQRAYAFVCSLLGAHYIAPQGAHPKTPGFGTLALAALGPNATVLASFQNFGEAWKIFAQEGRFSSLEEAESNPPTPMGRTVNGAVASTVTIPPGGTVEVPFLFGWHYPNKYNTHGVWMGCHYATQWANAREVVREAAAHYHVLRARTEQFRNTFYDSTLPYWLLDCVTANAAIIRHIGVVFRIANGDIYGWEGSNGCCQPTCTHVWGYEQSLARLFPDLEKEMRRIDFKHQQREDGGINNRTDVPSPPRPTGEQPFADGHASCILKAYREALNHPDESLFQAWWPHVKRAVEYLIARDAKSSGGRPSGVLQDDQWNTYDEALHGVTTFIGTYYLAALRAGEEWARRQNDLSTAERFHGLFEQGREKLIELCWNGEYFQQHLPGYMKLPGEVGPGCMADQLIGQWWAHQLGLGYLLPREMVQSSLRAIFKYNWMPDLTGWKHMPRAFAGARDKGLIICTWPKGGRPPHVMLYSDEVWTGIEYQVAAHMIYEGQLESAYAIVKGARDRYDGVPRPPIPRNPWNEIECGGHYARAMSSWSLLLALSGFACDGPRKTLRFSPMGAPEHFKSLFTGPAGWGSLRQTRQTGRQVNEIKVAEGRLAVTQVVLSPSFAPTEVSAHLDDQKLDATFKIAPEGVTVSLARELDIKPGQVLRISLAEESRSSR